MGPNWNAGKNQPSTTEIGVPPVDYGDLISLYHDYAYATDQDRKKADIQYAKDIIGNGEGFKEVVRNSVAGILVGVQGVARAVGAVQNEGHTPVGKNPFQDIRDKVKEQNKKEFYS